MTRPAKAIIDLQAIRYNYQLAKTLAPQSKALAIVKANAYGHGAATVALTLADLADGYGVASLEEALVLRDAGIRQRILLLEGCFNEEELITANQHHLDLCLHSEHQLQALEQANQLKPLTIWLKVDTGMHRLGFQPNSVASILSRLQQLDRVTEIILMTHLACADEADPSYTLQQLKTFATTNNAGLPSSIANSPGVLAWPESHRDWLRPGMMLYGASPLEVENAASVQLQPAMSLVSEVIAIQQLAAGEPIGYGGTYRCESAKRIAVVAMGYGDGYPRTAPSGTPVLVNGQRCALVGRVSMDMMTVDITHLSHCEIGTQVECWGKDLNIKEVAKHCRTIPYELVTRMTGRAPLIYKNA